MEKNSETPSRKRIESFPEKEEGMRTVLVQSNSSTGSTAEDDRSENRDSCYYPGCRKDANCNCEICLASINATLDLMPLSIQKSSITKLSVSRPTIKRTPISFDASTLSTPTSNACRIPSSPVIRSNDRSSLNQKLAKEKRKWGFSGINLLRLVMGLSLIFCVHIVFSWSVSGITGPALSPDIMKKVGEKSWEVAGLNATLRFLQTELQSYVDGEVSGCSSADSVWEICQNGLLLNSRCTFYKSAAEEVTVWGWPLQTAGLLTTGLSSRTMTVLSGRVTEWHGGKVGYLIRKTNSSWVQPKWDASVVQLDPNTWVLEYRRSFFFDNSRLLPAAWEILKYSFARIVRRVKQEFWLFAALEENQFSEFTVNYGTKIPT